jgi:hypothetical protein
MRTRLAENEVEDQLGIGIIAVLSDRPLKPRPGLLIQSIYLGCKQKLRHEVNDNVGPEDV